MPGSSQGGRASLAHNQRALDLRLDAVRPPSLIDLADALARLPDQNRTHATSAYKKQAADPSRDDGGPPLTPPPQPSVLRLHAAPNKPCFILPPVDPADTRSRSGAALKASDLFFRSLWRHIHASEQLTELEFSCVPLAPKMWHSLAKALQPRPGRAPSQSFPPLRKVILTGCPLGESCGALLRALAHTAALNHLDLSGCSIPHTAATDVAYFVRAHAGRRTARYWQGIERAWQGTLRPSQLDEPTPADAPNAFTVRPDGLDTILLARNHLGKTHEAAEKVKSALRDSPWLDVVDLRLNGFSDDDAADLVAAGASRPAVAPYRPLELLLEPQEVPLADKPPPGLGHFERRLWALFCSCAPDSSGGVERRALLSTLRREGLIGSGGLEEATRLRSALDMGSSTRIGSSEFLKSSAILEEIAAKQPKRKALPRYMLKKGEKPAQEILVLGRADGKVKRRRKPKPRSVHELIAASGGAGPLLDAFDRLLRDAAVARIIRG